ncbi:MAG: hypothetical protein J6U39_03135 [Clostridia bacterium]|nr:hypothetical protein [Clostridia bacterium]
MKRTFLFILAIVIALTSLSALPFTAHADTVQYLKVGKDDVSLYADKLVPAALFTIPKTYYVKVVTLNYTTEYHVVEYNGVRGLVKIADVGSEPVSDVQNPYFTSQSITAHVNTCLYTSPSFSADTGIAANGLSLTYLGKINGDKGSYGSAVWFAVLYANELYYLHCSLTNDLDLLESSFTPVHPNSVAADASLPTETQEGSEDGENASKSFDVVRLLLIIGMIVPLLIIFALLFRPRKRKSATPRRDRRRYPDEDDYDDDYDD